MKTNSCLELLVVRIILPEVTIYENSLGRFIGDLPTCVTVWKKGWRTNTCGWSGGSVKHERMASGVFLSSRDIVSLYFWAYRCIELLYIVSNVCAPSHGVPVLFVLILNEKVQHIEYRSCIDQMIRWPINGIEYTFCFYFDIISNNIFIYRYGIEQVFRLSKPFRTGFSITIPHRTRLPFDIHYYRPYDHYPTVQVAEAMDDKSQWYDFFVLILNDHSRHISVSIIASKMISESNRFFL